MTRKGCKHRILGAGSVFVAVWFVSIAIGNNYDQLPNLPEGSTGNADRCGEFKKSQRLLFGD